MKFIIDRFEGDFAVVELDNREMRNLPKDLIPRDAKEGDVLSIRVDRESTEIRKKRIEELMEDLWI